MSDPLGPRHSGHDYGAANLDAVGKAYIVFASLWTMVVMAGLTVLLMYRRLDFVRMRNTTLVASAVLTIHVYLVLAILLYPVNGAWPCDLEFWIMSVYFPLGIALFQAQVGHHESTASKALLTNGCQEHAIAQSELPPKEINRSSTGSAQEERRAQVRPRGPAQEMARHEPYHANFHLHHHWCLRSGRSTG